MWRRKTLEIGHSRILCLCSMSGFWRVQRLAAVPNFKTCPSPCIRHLIFHIRNGPQGGVSGMTGVQIATQGHERELR